MGRSQEGQPIQLIAPVYKLQTDFNYAKLGEIKWNGEGLQIDPSDSRELQQIAGKSYWVTSSKGIRKLSPHVDPVAWIRNLHEWYSGQIRVGKVRPPV